MNSDRIYSMLTPLMRRLVKDRMGANRRRYFEAVPVPRGRVLFLGDSITEGGLWSDLFPDLPTTNRGIGGEATYDLLERVDSTINDPLAVSLMIGTNDLHGPRGRRDATQVVDRTDEIVRRIRAAAPDTLLLLNSVLPRTEHFADQIRAINAGYRKVAERHGAEYVDLWPVFADDSGAVRQGLTRDNLHLTPAGYLAWADVLRPYLQLVSPR
jgi:lysophospholipase L1-like esterase